MWPYGKFGKFGKRFSQVRKGLTSMPTGTFSNYSPRGVSKISLRDEARNEAGENGCLGNGWKRRLNILQPWLAWSIMVGMVLQHCWWKDSRTINLLEGRFCPAKSVLLLWLQVFSEHASPQIAEEGLPDFKKTTESAHKFRPAFHIVSHMFAAWCLRPDRCQRQPMCIHPRRLQALMKHKYTEYVAQAFILSMLFWLLSRCHRNPPDLMNSSWTYHRAMACHPFISYPFSIVVHGIPDAAARPVLFQCQRPRWRLEGTRVRRCLQRHGCL